MKVIFNPVVLYVTLTCALYLLVDFVTKYLTLLFLEVTKGSAILLLSSSKQSRFSRFSISAGQIKWGLMGSSLKPMIEITSKELDFWDSPITSGAPDQDGTWVGKHSMTIPTRTRH